MTEIDGAIEMSSDEQWNDWLAAHGQSERQVWVVIFKKSSKKQTVSFDALLETALCNGWVDVQTKSVDDERYGIRFTRRKPGSNWSATNRTLVRRLLSGDRMKDTGRALLPPDL